MRSGKRLRACLNTAGCGLLVAALALGLWAQDPADSSDHPAGNVNELTLAGLRPGRTTLAVAEKRLGPHWLHPSADESDVYVWCDAGTRLRLSLEVQKNVVHVVTMEKLLPRLTASASATPRPVRASDAGSVAAQALGDSPTRLKSVYGKPFFQGPASWEGKDVALIVFNFSWAGQDKPQILESSFDAGRLVKMTLSAEYY